MSFMREIATGINALAMTCIIEMFFRLRLPRVQAPSQ